MRILFADQFPEPHRQVLAEAGHEVRFEPALTGDDLPTALGDAELLVVRSTKVSRETIESASELAMIVRAGAGTNTIDKAAAAERGIYVCNTPGKNALAVAELALGLLIALDRRIPDNVADLREGKWDKKTYSESQGLAGRSLGIVGVGDIGLAFAERAAACGMEVFAVAKAGRDKATLARAAAVPIHWVADIETLAQQVDVLSFHVPATPATAGLCGDELLELVKPGAWILNTSRGEVVDEDALLAAIEEKDLRVGLDVYADEPAEGRGTFTSRLAQHPNVYGTHHIGASTEQAQAAIAEEVLAIIEAFDQGEVRNCVNLEPSAKGAATLVVRHRNEVGALSGVLDVLKGAGINIEQMDNELFAGGAAAVATLHVSATPDDTTVSALTDLDATIHVDVRG